MILRRAIAHKPLHARKEHASVLPRRVRKCSHLDSLPKALAGSAAHGKCADAVLAIQKELAGIHGAAMARAQLGRAKDKARVITRLCARHVFAGHEMIVRRLSIGRIRDKRSIPRIRRADAQHGLRPRHHQNHANTGSENKGRRNDRQTFERHTGHIYAHHLECRIHRCCRRTVGRKEKKPDEYRCKRKHQGKPCSKGRARACEEPRTNTFRKRIQARNGPRCLARAHKRTSI